ncbi:hypothetical protein FJTKL_02736 [Diaporthe vaccinii]|uniref:Major facilitator superfamily (MFS) profile domain-containing protein n=1 Tax=Diaporthe vaccinii TaxID=105482 RepID=A0ABR4DXB1_9PEZI
MATATSSFLTGVCLIVTASIGRDLGMSQGQISWITASTSLVAGAFQLALGQLADLVGRKLMFIAGMGSFSALVLLTGFAQNPYWMLIMCGALGIPSAMVVPPAMGILGAAYKTPSRRKTSAFAAFSAGNPLGFVFGSIVCGVASSVSSWRAAYIFVAIVWAALAVFAVWAVPDVESFDSSSPLTERLKAMKDFDYVGTIMTVSGTGMLTASLTLGPSDGWKEPHIIALLVVGVALLLLFFVWELVFPTPLMPPHIWRDRDFTLIIIVLLLGMIGFQGSTFWLTYYMQDIQELPSLTIVAHLVPMILGGIVWNILAAKTIHRVNNTLIMAFGSAGYIAAGLLFAFMKQDSLYWAFMFPGMILTVAGGDLQNNVANVGSCPFTVQSNMMALNYVSSVLC